RVRRLLLEGRCRRGDDARRDARRLRGRQRRGGSCVRSGSPSSLPSRRRHRHVRHPRSMQQRPAPRARERLDLERRPRVERRRSRARLDRGGHDRRRLPNHRSVSGPAVAMRVLACVLLLLLLPSSAYAGQTLYGWLPATNTVPSGTFELGSSLYEHVDLGPYHERSTALLLTPAVGLLDALELAFPVELVTRTQD